VREIKDAMSREILDELTKAGIEVASTTFVLTGLPPVQVKVEEEIGAGEKGQR
jgi:hypothetical protein